MNTQAKSKKVVKVEVPVKAKTKTAKKKVELKNLTSDEIFLETLKELGKPSLVRDMVKAIKKKKIISTTKKKLLAKLYASASHLNRDGRIKRTPVNGSMFAYSLLRWKKTKVKLAA